MTTAAQDTLIERIVALLERDKRIAAAWLAGSIGRGEEDEWSDVDVVALVTGNAAEIGRTYAERSSAITDTVYADPLYGGAVVNCITPDWQRFDLSFIEHAQLSRYDAKHLKALFNKGAPEPGGPAPSAEPPMETRVLRIVREFLRVLGLTPLGMGREEYVNGLTGIGHLRTALIDLMIEENGIAPRDRGGVLHLNRLLTEEQRKVLEALPPLSPTRQSLLEANVVLASLFLPRAKSLCRRLGVAWPESMEAALRAYLLRTLGLRI
jgi:predicted nucleotidyltransferase